MARAKPSFSTTNALAIFLVCITIVGQAYGKLEIGFYTGKCQTNDVEKIIFDIVSEAFDKDFKIVAALLRMQFHDCFVRVMFFNIYIFTLNIIIDCKFYDAV